MCKFKLLYASKEFFVEFVAVVLYLSRGNLLGLSSCSESSSRICSSCQASGRSKAPHLVLLSCLHRSLIDGCVGTCKLSIQISVHVLCTFGRRIETAGDVFR
eukprot:766921-Hanusia_phi.AAC.3